MKGAGPCGGMAGGSTAARSPPRGAQKFSFSRGREPGRAAAAGRPATDASLLHMRGSMIENVMASMDGGSNCFEGTNMFPISNRFSEPLATLPPAYQSVLPHGLIKINDVNNYNYVSHALFHQLNILTHTLKYIFIII